jgi:hypothetical protein
VGHVWFRYLGEAVAAPARGDGFLLGEKQGAGHAGGFSFLGET